MRMERRTLVKALAAIVGAGVVGTSVPAFSQQKEVRVAMIAPMSGPWARQGELMARIERLGGWEWQHRVETVPELMCLPSPLVARQRCRPFREDDRTGAAVR